MKARYAAQTATLTAFLNAQPQFAQRLRAIARIFRRKAGKCIGQNVGMMKILHVRIAAEVQPQPMYKLDITRGNTRRMRSNVEAFRLARGWHDVEGELALWIRQGLPGLTNVVGLLRRG